MYLLNKQTEIEQESKRGEKVFEEKMKIYWKIFDDTEDMLDDGKISKEDEMKKLPFVMARLITVGSDKVIDSFQNFYDQVNKTFESKPEHDTVTLDEVQKQNLMLSLIEFSNTCRVDLGISDYQIDKKIFVKTTQAIEKSSKIVGRNIEIDDDDPENPLVDSATEILPDGKYKIDRHKNGGIRIYINGKFDKKLVVKNTLKYIDEELGLNIDEKRWSQTQNAGRAIIAKLNELKKNENEEGKEEK